MIAPTMSLTSPTLHSSVRPLVLSPSIVLAVVLWPAVASTSSAAVITSDATTVEPAEVASASALRVTVADGIDDAAELPQWIAERSAAKMADLPESPGGEQWVQVEISGSTYDYRLMVTAMRDGQLVGDPRDPMVCECTSEQLLQRADEEIARAVEELAAEPPPEEGTGDSGDESGPEPDTGAAAEPNPPNDDPPPRPLGIFGKVGIGLAATGGAGLIAGGIVLAQGRQIDNPSSRYLRPEGRDYRPPGIATLATAGVVTVVGVALLVVDRVRARRGSKPGPRASLAPGGRSVSFAVRF